MGNGEKRAARHRYHVGRPPGSIGYTGVVPEEPVEISLFSYDARNLEERTLSDVGELKSLLKQDRIFWVNFNGIHDEKILHCLLQEHGIHPLVLEDVGNVNHRPKAEYFDTFNFFILKMLYREKTDGLHTMSSEQVSLILGRNYVFSFQERKGDVFDPIRERLRKAKGRIRSSGADYLAYCLMDAITDNYFLLLEDLGGSIEEIEEALAVNPAKETLAKIHHMKQDLIRLRHSVWPQREVISFMQREDSPLVSESIQPYLRDLYDHTIQVMDSTEGFRDMLTSMIDLYMSGVSNRMNEVMKVLTIIATIFIPLSFIAGIYGMNFNGAASPLNMPELSWRYGYFFALGLMAMVGGGMVLYFKKKKWF